jgi:Helix-turn-helix
MSNNPGDAATPARERETEQTQTPDVEQNAQGAQAESSQPHPDNPDNARNQGEPSFATQLSDNPQASAAETRNETFQAIAGGGQPQTGRPHDQILPAPSQPSNAPMSSAATATPQSTGDQSEGVADSAEITGGTSPQTDDNARMQTPPKPDVSDQDWQQLVPKLMALFNNNREQLGRALGLHRSTVDRWLNGKSRPNTSTILRMRRLAQERHIE